MKQQNMLIGVYTDCMFFFCGIWGKSEYSFSVVASLKIIHHECIQLDKLYFHV